MTCALNELEKHFSEKIEAIYVNNKRQSRYVQSFLINKGFEWNASGRQIIDLEEQNRCSFKYDSVAIIIRLNKLVTTTVAEFETSEYISENSYINVFEQKINFIEV